MPFYYYFIDFVPSYTRIGPLESLLAKKLPKRNQVDLKKMMILKFIYADLSPRKSK